MKYILFFLAFNAQIAVAQHPCCFGGTFATITDIQNALQNRGYLQGIANKMDRKNGKALKRFQKDKGLPKGNLNQITVRALGLLPVEE